MMKWIRKLFEYSNDYYIPEVNEYSGHYEFNDDGTCYWVEENNPCSI